MLIYNYFTSSQTAGADTRLSLTNTHASLPVRVKLYFVDGNSGSVASSAITVAPMQAQSFLASSVDPSVTGYIIALAVNEADEPLPFDHLLGTALIQLVSGHQATLGALAVPIKSDGNGTGYAALPRQLALDQIPSPASGVKQMLIINRLDGSLTSLMYAIGRLQCEMFNPQGTRFSFLSRTYGPQARTFYYNLSGGTLTSSSLFNFVPAGQYGWLRLRPTAAGAITGAVLYFRDSGSTTVPAQGSYNLRHLTTTQTSLSGPTGILEFGY
jgi:hypothetical protein